MRGAVTQALHRRLAKHTESPMEAAAHLQLEAVRRAAAEMVHRKHLLLTHAEQLTDPTTREHMQRLIHYHAVHDPDVHQPTPRPANAPHLHPQASKTPPKHPKAHLSPKKPSGTAQPGQAQPGPTIRRRERAGPPGHPPPPPTTIRDPDLLRATLQGRALSTPLGWYRLQEDWAKLTAKALRDLTTPGNGLHEAIVDLILWRVRQHSQGQHVWIPPIEWGQALTHDTDTNVTRQGTIRLRRAPAKKDHPADPNHPEQWEQATAPNSDTALRAAGLRTPDDNLPPPPIDSDQPPPEVWCTVLERGHYYVVAATPTSPGPQ